jgi:hypothetical protein
MIAAVCARKSTEQSGVADDQKSVSEESCLGRDAIEPAYKLNQIVNKGA